MPKPQLSAALKGVFLTSCALTLPAMAQEQAAEQYVQECVDLFAFVEESDAFVLDEEPEILAVIERNRGPECQRLMARLERQADAGETASPRAARRPLTEEPAQRQAQTQAETDRQMMTAQETERETVTAEATETVEEEVTVQETVTVTGEVDVAMPVPTVEVDQQGADVQVRQQPPRVAVDMPAHEILIREQAPTVRISAPTVTIEQAPPEIIITMPDPSVDVASAEPQVEVRQPEPQVRVSIGEPQVGLDLRAVSGEEGENVRTRVSRLEEETPRERDGMRLLAGNAEGMNANVYVAEAEANVRMAGADARPQIDISNAEPNLRYESAEPVIEMTGEPDVQYSRTGEPNVMIRRPGDGQDQARARGQQQERGGDQMARLTERGQQGPYSGGMAAVRVSELIGAEIMGANGDEIGEIERLVKLDGAIYAMVEHGGFLGIGEDMIPMPINGLTLVDGGLMAPGVTEDDMERWSEQDMSRATDLDTEDGVRLRQG